MRISEWTGVWLKYRDSARPVITLNQVTYAFNNDARECLVSREDHIQYFLETGQYRIAGIEVADESVSSVTTVVPEEEPEEEPRETPKRRGRPRGRTR